VLVLLWVFIYLTMYAFGQTDDTAENLLIPYLLWATFAGYLNLGVALLN
jgi:tryptophan-rich sensory protein